MDRRRAGRILALGAMVMLLGGHTPYGQWVVYRRKHLLIGCHRDDPVTYDLAKLTVATLATHLPAAQARVARAPDARRLASLLGTEQMEVAILGAADAGSMLWGTGRFTAYGPIALRALAQVSDRVLCARADFPERHAWLVTGALSELPAGLAGATREDPGIPWHPGSAAFREGRPEPGAG